MERMTASSSAQFRAIWGKSELPWCEFTQVKGEGKTSLLVYTQIDQSANRTTARTLQKASD